MILEVMTIGANSLRGGEDKRLNDLSVSLSFFNENIKLIQKCFGNLVLKVVY